MDAYQAPVTEFDYVKQKTGIRAYKYYSIRRDSF